MDTGQACRICSCYGKLAACFKIITFSSDMSSIAYRTPSRPMPESFTPPYAWESVLMLGTSLMITPPASICSNA
eukprot:scaffold3793_cov397-Prasinococcus_capsulatus_cf.AAC.3